MNKKSLSTWIATFAVAVLVAGPANAILIAGWDLSQYISGGGVLDTDGAPPLDGAVLSANYSNRIPVQLGPTAAPYGTMFINGQFGSTLVPLLGDGSEDILPTETSLGGNLNAPVLGGNVLQFDSLGQLNAQGQIEENLMKMSLLGPTAIDVVFRANTVGLPGTDWVISFGGRANTQSSNVTVQFSDTGDAADYQTAQIVLLTTADAPITVPLSVDAETSMWVRLRFDGSGQANFDNIAINANIIPEPATGLLLAAGLAGLAACRRSRA